MALITVNAPLVRTCVPGIASLSSVTGALATKRRSAKSGRLLPASRLMGSDGLDSQPAIRKLSRYAAKSHFRQLRSCCFRKPRLKKNTLQGHDWLALDGERIVILATPAIAFHESGGQKTIRRGR